MSFYIILLTFYKVQVMHFQCMWNPLNRNFCHILLVMPLVGVGLNSSGYTCRRDFFVQELVLDC